MLCVEKIRIKQFQCGEENYSRTQLSVLSADWCIGNKRRSLIMIQNGEYLKQFHVLICDSSFFFLSTALLYYGVCCEEFKKSIVETQHMSNIASVLYN